MKDKENRFDALLLEARARINMRRVTETDRVRIESQYRKLYRSSYNDYSARALD